MSARKRNLNGYKTKQKQSYLKLFASSNIIIKMIAYLRTTKPFLMSPGIYDHPFKEGTRLLGPYLYTDDNYYWDRDTWKYVVKYGLELPQVFIDHVMSDVGTEFIEQQINANESWSEAVKQWKKKKGSSAYCLIMPEIKN